MRSVYFRPLALPPLHQTAGHRFAKPTDVPTMKTDLDNGETRDTIDFTLDLGGIALKGPWHIMAMADAVELEDWDRSIQADRERSKMALLDGYRFRELGSSQMG
jgi:hypothetical protein